MPCRAAFANIVPSSLVFFSHRSCFRYIHDSSILIFFPSHLTSCEAACVWSSLNPALSDPRSLGPVVDQALLEPRVAECLLRRDAFGGIVDEYFLQQVEELFVENGGGGNDILFRESVGNWLYKRD